MKTFFTLIISLLLLTVFIHTTGCQKAEETTISRVPSSPGTSPASPGIPEKSGTSESNLSAPQTPAAPGQPAVAPETPTMPAEKDIILVTKFDADHMTGNIPPEWILDTNGGTSFIKVEKEANNCYFHMASDGESSFGIKKEVKVDVREYPFLNWRWKVTRLPKGGDVRKSGSDDQAIQLYIAFPSTGFPAKLNTPVVGYIWDNEAPKGWMGRSPQIGGWKLRYVVVRNKADKLGQWYIEKRNLYEDYKKLFRDVKAGDPQGETQGIQLHINSQHTKSIAESYICEVYFSKN